MTHKSEFKKFSDDLKMQERMNLAFLKSVPQIDKMSLGVMGKEAQTFTVPEFIPQSKILRNERELKRFK